MSKPGRAERGRVHFTADRVAKFACEPGKAQAFFWDDEARGLGVRVTAAGAKSYVFEGWLHGKSFRVTIGSLREWPIDGPAGETKTARFEARRLKNLTDQGIDPRHLEAEKRAKVDAAREQAKAQTALVSDAWAAYLAYHRERMALAYAKKKWGARHFADHERLAQAGGAQYKRGQGETKPGPLYPLLQMRLADVNAAVLAEWMRKEAADRPSTARQAFVLFRTFWRWCADRPEYSGIGDAAAIASKDLRAEVPVAQNKRFDVLERAHMKAWFAAVRAIPNPVISAYLQGLALTGARREELAGLRWENVDFGLGAIWIRDKVQAEGRKVPLTPYLASLLRALPRRNEWVFSSPGAKDGKIAEPRIAHVRALDAAGLPHVTLHGLRRTFASLAEWVEMPHGIVAQIMGHTPSATAERHYISRPLELLAVWHTKYEAWILKEAGIDFEAKADAPRLQVVG